MRITRTDAVEFTAFAYSPADLILYWTSWKGLFGVVDRFEIVGQLYAFDFIRGGNITVTGTKTDPLLMTHVEGSAVFLQTSTGRVVRAMASDTRMYTLEVFIRNRRD